MNTHCDNCGNEIVIQIFRGTDHCSDLCRKALESARKEADDSGSEKKVSRSKSRNGGRGIRTQR